MLLDDYFPEFDAFERHHISIAAPPERVYAAIRATDLGGHAVVRLLLAVRSIPGWLWSRRAAAAAPAHTTPERAKSLSRAVTLAALERRGFVVLAENAPNELLIGLQGRFWTPTGRLEPLDAATALTPIPPGRARAGWNFVVTATSGGRAVLSTETRVACSDSATRRKFLWYWRLIRPGSGLIRRAMLRNIRRTAEAAAPVPPLTAAVQPPP